MNRGKRPARKAAARRVWSLSVIWLRDRQAERPQVVVVYVDAATGAVMGAGRRLSKPFSGRGSPPE